MNKDTESTVWIHESDERFTDYYARASQSVVTVRRFRSIRDSALRVASANSLTKVVLDVADIGCGAGTQSFIWAELGHKVHGLDVNQPLLEVARQRAGELQYTIDFQLGSATKLPWADQSMDICLLIELLEHVSGWQACLQECARVLRPGGILALTTSNKLCPFQQEFNLPLYSWYPGLLKRYFENLAVTTRPKLANYAKYPAVNWFSFYGLRTMLSQYGFMCLDRFDVVDLSKKDVIAQGMIRAVRNFSILRWFAHVATEGTILIGVKMKD
jgi:2-polyprenyl-6-hydroxyphenyl methylase/3-demethylubiquinone-9 3-methyltransferase